MSDYWINVPILVFLIPTVISVFLFIAANLKPLAVTFSSHHHNSSTVLLSTPTLWSTPSPIHSCSPIPTLENLKSEAHVSMLFWNNVILRHNNTVKQLSVSLIYAILWHVSGTIQTSPDCSCTVINTIYSPKVWHISNKISNSSSQFSHTVYCKH